ncbi:hypothetical protein [Cupriavidus pauculus]|uniref:Uncharacterized protein n=1 Tax=Cupriavidus pauculus TaxID=82633 RepID=A0A2N5C5C5_9BURK|nr:hypothetical protein [Cupriavidus pauculus]PLP97421.1 hypothetical protein CYJ10_26620 [Cupriavidus pauculus]
MKYMFRVATMATLVVSVSLSASVCAAATLVVDWTVNSQPVLVGAPLRFPLEASDVTLDMPQDLSVSKVGIRRCGRAGPAQIQFLEEVQRDRRSLRVTKIAETADGTLVRIVIENSTGHIEEVSPGCERVVRAGLLPHRLTLTLRQNVPTPVPLPVASDVIVLTLTGEVPEGASR